MIDDLYEDGTAAVFADLVRRPNPAPPPKAPGFFTGLADAPRRAIGAGVAKSLAFGAEVTGAFGSVLGAYPEGFGIDVTPQQREQADVARAKLLKAGPTYSNEAGDLFRQQAADYTPDPKTSGLASQLVVGFGGFLTEVGIGTLVAGPLAPAWVGGTTAFDEADRLKQQGVDLGTRAKAAAVTGAVNAAMVAFPMAGATRAARAATGVAIGESGIVGQTAAVQTILRHAGYEDIASHYDPFDPVGLAVGAVPGFLGAAMGGARAAPARGLADVVKGMESGGKRYGKDGELLTSPKGAQGEMQVMPKTATDPGFGVVPAMDSSPEELARVGRDYLAAMQQRYPGDDAKAMAAYNAGPGRLDAAVVKNGAEWLAHMPEETRAYVATGLRQMGEGRTADAVKANPDLVPAARVAQTAESIDAARLTTDADMRGRNAHAEAMDVAGEQLARGDSVDVAAVMHDQQIDPARMDAITIGATERAKMLQTLEGPDPWEAPTPRTPIDLLPHPSERADDLRSMATAAGWAQEGGKLLRAPLEDGMGVQGEVSGRTTWIPTEEWFGRMRSDLGRGGLSNKGEISAAIEKAIVGEKMTAREQRTVDWVRQEAEDIRMAFRAREFAPDAEDLATRDAIERGLGKADALDTAMVARAAELDKDAVEAAHYAHPADDAAFMASIRKIIDAESQKSTAHEARSNPPGGNASRGAAARGEEVGAGSDGQGTPEHAEAFDRRVAELEAAAPDMPVLLPDGERTTLREALADIKDQFTVENADAQLAQVAADCALRNV